MKNITLSEGEWKLMSSLWDIAPCSLGDLVKSLEGETGWSKSTVFVMLKRLISKNAVELDTGGKIQLYTPLIKKEDAVIKETTSFLQRVYSGSIGLMVSSMAGQNFLSDNDIEELRRVLDEMEQKRK